MREYKGFDVWSTLVMKDGKWVNLPNNNDNQLPPIPPSEKIMTRRMESMDSFAREREEENRAKPSERKTGKKDSTDDESSEAIMNEDSEQRLRTSASGKSTRRNSEIVKQKLPKGFVSGVKKIDWPPHILKMDRKLENERRAKEKAQAKKERQYPKYKEIEHVSTKINREAEIARRKLILNDRKETLEKLKKRHAELEIILQNLRSEEETG